MDTQIQQNKINPLIAPGITDNEQDKTVKNNDFTMDNMLYPGLKRIGVIVAEYFNLQLWQLKLKTREAKIRQPRQIAMYFAKEFSNNSLTSIGAFYGGKDHSTVHHAYKVCLNDYKTDHAFRKDIDTLSDLIKHSIKKDMRPAYYLEVDDINKQVHVRTSMHFCFADFKKLSEELEAKDVDDDYKIVML